MCFSGVRKLQFKKLLTLLQRSIDDNLVILVTNEIYAFEIIMGKFQVKL